MDFPEVKADCRRAGGLVPLEALFSVRGGLSSSEVIRRAERANENWIPYIRPSYRQETSIDAYVNKNAVPREKIFPAQTLYVSTDGQGSHTFSYVSAFEFVPNSNVSVLLPLREMTLQEKLFYAQCITGNRYKFSYGRKPKGRRLKSVMLPEYPPDYVLSYNMDRVMHKNPPPSERGRVSTVKKRGTPVCREERVCAGNPGGGSRAISIPARRHKSPF